MMRCVRISAWVFLATMSGAVLGACRGTAQTGAPLPAAKEGRAAAGTTPTAASGSTLAGTQWRLVEIRSMDDAQGTTKPDDPSLYTMRLDAGGSVAMRLNCNRATGTWKAEPSAEPSSGRFEFGPLAGTRALCPPPSLDERVVSQAQHVRSYVLKDGRLHLSLMADGGIYIWERAPE